MICNVAGYRPTQIKEVLVWNFFVWLVRFFEPIPEYRALHLPAEGNPMAESVLTPSQAYIQYEDMKIEIKALGLLIDDALDSRDFSEIAVLRDRQQNLLITLTDLHQAAFSEESL